MLNKAEIIANMTSIETAVRSVSNCPRLTSSRSRPGDMSCAYIRGARHSISSLRASAGHPVACNESGGLNPPYAGAETDRGVPRSMTSAAKRELVAVLQESPLLTIRKDDGLRSAVRELQHAAELGRARS